MSELDGFYFLTASIPALLLALLIALYKTRTSVATKARTFFITWNLTALMFLVSTFFFLGETYFRLFVDTTDSFGLNKITQRWGNRYYQFNNLGARDNLDYELNLAPGKRRITFVGDSFTAGHGITDVEHRFANLIRQHNPEWEVHVMAANGMETVDELDLIQKLSKVDQYQFDLVVLVYNLNDIAYLLPKTEEIYQRVYSFEKRLNYLGKNSYFINTLFFRWVASRDPDIRHYYHYVKEGYFSTKWETQAANLTALNDYLEQQGSRLMVVTFPFLQNFGGNGEFKEVHIKLAALWKSLSVPHLDLLQVYRKRQDEKLVVNAYDAHPNETAHGIAAKIIEKFVRKNLAESRSADTSELN
jgi:lysophospholipase L1-like esterase